MKTNLELQRDVQDELRWEPMLNAAEIGVISKDGVITLTGSVESYTKKLVAERAAKRVAGVKAVAVDIEVILSESFKRTDGDIAKAALNALKWSTSVPDERIKLKVENGWVTIEGEVEWEFQKDAARICIEDLSGVRGVSNLISIKPKVNTTVIKENIKKALERNATLDAQNIRVESTDGKIILKGSVHSWFEKKEAEKVAWSAPGVKEVDDEISISV